jgi:hypothetical protein
MQGEKAKELRAALEESLYALLKHDEVRPVRWWEFEATSDDAVGAARRLRDERRAPVLVEWCDGALIFARGRATH